jgi:trehalose/maltose hydrolase-like predicted phosphorylase
LARRRDVNDNEFDLLIFDWDGTAVQDRESPIYDLLAALERTLAEARIECVVITGTNVQNLLQQGLERLSQAAKEFLYLCTNRGSEVWGFDKSGALISLYKREATSEENAWLDHAAVALKEDFESKGLKTEIIFKRLNRRKIDLIPEPAWANPKKSEFKELLAAVTKRLQLAGICGNIDNLIQDAYQIARSSGLVSPRITSDIKHIEIGLTDKSDSVRWVNREIIEKRNLSLNRVAIVGDEFGMIGGLQGSDALLRIPELQAAHFISVGIEPEGVPPWVEHRPGGPIRFLEILNNQFKAWQVVQEGFEPSRERNMETLFAVGNGYLCTRGTSDFPVPAAQPDLFVAGIYDSKETVQPYSELEFMTTKRKESLETELAPLPSPFLFHLRINQTRLMISSGTLESRTRTLNMKDGIYREDHSFKDELGRRTRVRSMRCASFADPHLLFQEIKILSENYSARLELDFFSPVSEFISIYPHYSNPSAEPVNRFEYVSKGSRMKCVLEAKTFLNGKLLSPKQEVTLNPGDQAVFRRVIAVFSSRDCQDPARAAERHLNNIPNEFFEDEISRHSKAWNRFWEAADLSFHGAPELTQAQRFNIYHLRISADHDPKISIPAKGLVGRAYEGHIFWDSEIFMFPFFLYTEPEIAKNLLLYRYNTLAGARKRAKEMGYRGACYAWESTLSGEDETPLAIFIKKTDSEIPIFTGSQQIHISADVAFAVCRYWDATLDFSFLCDFGAEILIETARFWTSRVSFVDGLFHILKVVGPDEYHHCVDDNAYTNWMAKFNLEKALWACSLIAERKPDAYKNLALRLSLREGELDDWKHIAQNLLIAKPDKNGVIEQFRGFRGLTDVAIPQEQRHHAPISRLFNWKELNKLKVVKQADVLMIPFLFPEALPREVVEANFDYYDPLTDYGSSLGLCIQAAIAQVS